MSRRSAARLIDWERVIEDLNVAGLCPSEVARRLEVNRSTLQYWLTGGEPGYSDGARLLALHLQETGLQVTERRVEYNRSSDVKA